MGNDPRHRPLGIPKIEGKFDIALEVVWVLAAST
jgi:hypothetical protein